MVTVEKIKFWIENNWNVLLKGRHGTGKTSILKQACEELGLEWGKEVLYFSGATLDPYVDFGGVPIKKVNNQTGEEFLDFLHPKCFQNDVKVIILDEYNRSHKKVRNATMELIQFKSINGKKLEHLKCVLAAVNPEEDTDLSYDVEDIDPAQEDRFYIQVEVPYEINGQYFSDRYGTQMSDSSIEWWDNLPQDVKLKVSPRRVDYALEVYCLNGDISDVLPVESNPTKLKKSLFSIPAIKRFKQLIEEGNSSDIKQWLEDENNYYDIEKILKLGTTYYDLTIPNLSPEKIAKLVYNCHSVKNFCLQKFGEYNNIKEVLQNIVESKSDEKLASEIEWHLEKKNLSSKADKNLKDLETGDETDKMIEEIFGELINDN